MWESAITVERSQSINASPAQVWSLLSSPAAWSVRPDRFAFDVTAPSDARLRVVLGRVRKRSWCVLYEIRDQVPGEVISVHAPGTVPPGRQVFTLSAAPDGRGTRATIVARRVVWRGSKGETTDYLRAQLKTWLRELRAVAEGSTPWPAAGMPPGLQEACSPKTPPKAARETSASALISAPLSQVWEAIYAPEPACLIHPEHVICAGRVPGTPTRQAGEMQYFIMRHGDRLWAEVTMLTEFTDQHSVLNVSLVPRHTATLYLVMPAAEGTRLDLTYRWPGKTGKRRDREALERRLADWMQSWATGYKRLVEDADRGQP